MPSLSFQMRYIFPSLQPPKKFIIKTKINGGKDKLKSLITIKYWYENNLILQHEEELDQTILIIIKPASEFTMCESQSNRNIQHLYIDFDILVIKLYIYPKILN